MDVRQALIAAFAATLSCQLGPKEEAFQFSGRVEPHLLQELIKADRSKQANPDNWSTTIACEEICVAHYSYEIKSTSGWLDGVVESCELNLPSGGGPWRGYLSCSGHAQIQHYCMGEGRRPLGHVEVASRECGSVLGQALAAMAHLEAASIHAFEQLAAQLASWRPATRSWPGTSTIGFVLDSRPIA
jgi:hypothetical protein